MLRKLFIVIKIINVIWIIALVGCTTTTTIHPLNTPTFDTIPPPKPPGATHHVYHKTVKPVVILVRPGSLQQNIIRIVRPYHWRVIWQADVDYHFIGTVRIRATSLQGALQQLLKRYPLQAVFYQGNKIILIRERVI